MWSLDEIKSYDGELCIYRDFEDAGFAFVETLQIFKEGQDEPIYEEQFHHAGGCDELLESLGFVQNGSENGWVKPPKGFTISEKLINISLYKLIHRIGEIVFEYCTSDPGKNLDSLWMEDRRNQGPNPFYNQTKQGIFLEMYYGLPSSLWTPWGKWSIGGSGCGNFNEVNEKIFERLGAQLHIRQQDTNMGTYGPVYRLTKVDDIELPVAEVEHHSKFAEYEEVKIAWKNMEIDTQNVDIEKRNMGGVNDEVRTS